MSLDAPGATKSNERPELTGVTMTRTAAGSPLIRATVIWQGKIVAVGRTAPGHGSPGDQND